MRRFLAMFGFSFLVIGLVLLYYAWQALTGSLIVPRWQLMIYALGGGCALALGAAGLRERHKKVDRR